MKKPHYYIPTILILIIIFGFSSQNGQDSGHLSLMVYNYLIRLMHLPFSFSTLHLLLRKCAHLTEFGCLALSLSFGMRHNDVKKTCQWALLFACFFACLDECHQLFVVDRAGQITDVMIDTLGAGLFLLLEAGIRKLWTKRKKASEDA